MKTMGFLISHKSGEKRRAILPCDIFDLKFVNNCYFEKGYGAALGISDGEYIKAGCNVVSREKCLECDIITDVKLGDADYLSQLSSSKILFGWAHAVQNLDFTSEILKAKHTVIAWEDIYEDGRYIFYRNREIAGEAAVLHAFRFCGKMPYDTKVAILGNGQTAKGVLRVLHGLGAEVDVYGRRLENLFKKNMYNYDVLINCILWDTNRTDHIITKEDVYNMKKGTLIIDVSCDPHLEIETSHATSIDNPIYIVNDVIHYAVDNTPAMFPLTVSKVLSKGIKNYIDMIIENDFVDYPDNIKKATIILNGKILDDRIRSFRKQRGL